MRETAPLDLEAYRRKKLAAHPLYKEPSEAERENHRDQLGNQLDFTIWKRDQVKDAVEHGNTLPSLTRGDYGEMVELKIDARFLKGIERVVFSRYEDLREAGDEGHRLAQGIVENRHHRSRKPTE